jgi:hypothetical protein
MSRAAVLSALTVVLAATGAHAQAEDAQSRPQVRVDAIVANHWASVQAGAGLQIPVGYYVRVGVDGAVGTDVVTGNSTLGSNTVASGRVDVIARFLFDPFRQQRYGLSAGGGVSARASQHGKVRPYLVAVLDLEGPRSSRGLSPAVQLGLGGGVRLGALLRWTAARVR